MFVLIKESYGNLLNEVSCPFESGVSMHVSNVVSRFQEVNSTMYLVQAYKQDVTVSCQSMDKHDISLNLTHQLESEIKLPSTNNSVVAWPANYTNMWSRKNASCSLADQDKPSCQVQMTLLVNHKSNCTANETNSLTCNIRELIKEMRKEKSCSKCTNVCRNKSPSLNFHVYQSSNESWIKCESKKLQGPLDSYEDPKCPIQYTENESVVIKLSMEWNKGGFKREICEESIYTTISASNVVIIYSDIQYATYAFIGVAAAGVIIIILFCCLMNWKRKIIKIGRTSWYNCLDVAS